MININSINENNSSQTVRIDKIPDECPICHKKIRPIQGQAFLNTKPLNNILEVVYRCPDENCRNIFIGFYFENGGIYYYKLSKPYEFIPREFSEIINSISPDFVKIYNQAYAAEQAGLNVICGAGYRKALEFLIKDYLISKNHDDAEKIKKEFLGSLIDKRVDRQQIKVAAKRAVWLGNDETHYERKWQDKEIKDLKALIELTLHWIEDDKLTEKFLKEMPDK